MNKKGALQNNSFSQKQSLLSVGEGLAPPARSKLKLQKKIRRFRKNATISPYIAL
jgi:hypothetical protein